MPVEFRKKQKKLVALLSGEIDHHAAETLRRQIDRRIEQDKPEILCLDFAGVTFMDSSGVGLVMGRYRKLCPFGGMLELCGMSGAVRRIMRLSGIGQIASVTEQRGGVK